MKWNKPAVVVIVTGSLCLFWGRLDSAGAFELPKELKTYRAWSRLLTEPRPVPVDLWFRCAPPTTADWDAARQRNGPHTQRFIMVYGNGPAVKSLSREGKRSFAQGAIIAKEKLLDRGATAPDGVAFMVKREEPEFRDTGGWEFLYFPSAGNGRQTHERCASCHRSAASGDYVFRQYPWLGGWAFQPQNK